MSDPPDPPLPPQLSGSLCARCRQRRTIVSGTGSVFLLCQRGLLVEDWPKYPPQPISHCPHFCDAASSVNRLEE